MTLNRLSVTFILLLATSPGFAQQALYAASKSGLNLREQANASAPVITKIPYGAKVSLLEENYKNEFVTEGMKAHWTRISYEGRTGYAADVYLLPFVPPSSTNMSSYPGSLSKLLGSSHKVISYTWEGQPSVSRQLYENGMAQRIYRGYEEESETVWIPGISLEQGFVLARLLSGVPELLSLSDTFPAKSGASANGRSILIGNFMLRYEICTTACFAVEIRAEDNEVSILFSSAL